METPQELGSGETGFDRFLSMRDARVQQARRLESIGELAGGVAHDFNHLLGVILGNAQAAVDELGSDSPVDRELQAISRAARHAAELTERLLVFSREEARPLQPVDLNEVIGGVEGLVARTIGDRIDLRVRLAKSLPPVMADPSQLEQILLNLAINARDAMPGGGRLLVETLGVELDEEYARVRPELSPGHYIRLTVADDGVGMDPDVRQRAFEPFFSTRADGTGTGLGLATVYAIVKSFDGHVAIYSEPAHGTVVRVHLPIAADAAGDRPADDDEVLSGGGERVLVVEDGGAIRRIIERILERGGYQAVSTGDPDKAIRIFSETEVDLVLTDVVMPDITGPELAEQLAEIRPEVPVLYATGYGSSSALVPADARVVEKPFTAAVLLSEVREAILARA